MAAESGPGIGGRCRTGSLFATTRAFARGAALRGRGCGARSHRRRACGFRGFAIDAFDGEPDPSPSLRDVDDLDGKGRARDEALLEPGAVPGTAPHTRNHADPPGP